MDSGLEYENLIKQMVRSVGSGSVGLHLRSELMGELSALSHSWLALGVAVPPESARPQMSKNAENKRHGIPAVCDHFFFWVLQWKRAN